MTCRYSFRVTPAWGLTGGRLLDPSPLRGGDRTAQPKATYPPGTGSSVPGSRPVDKRRNGTRVIQITGAVAVVHPHAEQTTPCTRHVRDRGRSVALPHSYRDRTGNVENRCLASDMSCFCYPFPLVTETHNDLLKIRPVWVRVRLGARYLLVRRYMRAWSYRSAVVPLCTRCVTLRGACRDSKQPARSRQKRRGGGMRLDAPLLKPWQDSFMKDLRNCCTQGQFQCPAWLQLRVACQLRIAARVTHRPSADARRAERERHVPRAVATGARWPPAQAPS